MNLHRLIGVMGIALCMTLTLPAFAQWAPNVEGYAQFRYEYSDSEGDGDFDTRRVRLSWKDEVNDEGTMARIQIDLGDLLEDEGQEIDPKDLWVWHPFSESWSARFGYGDVMFGKDVEYSSSSRLPFERAVATTSFFPSEKCLGIFSTFEGQNGSNLVFDLGVIDGMDAWHRGDFEDAESLVANVELPFGDGSTAGVSYMTSNIEVANVNDDLDSDVFGLHVQYVGSGPTEGFFGQAEYYDGDWYDHRAYSVHAADGFYGLLAFTPEGSDATPFYRYDEFNAGDAADYSRHTFGVAYEPWASNRITLQVEDIEDGADEDTTVGIQWQVKYK